MDEKRDFENLEPIEAYEPPVLLDLEEVVAGDCNVCDTGGGGS